MWLGAIIGLAVVGILGFEINFYVWLGVFTSLMAMTAFILTKNKTIIKYYFPAAITAVMSLTMVPFLLQDSGLSPSQLKYATIFFNYGPVFLAFVSLAVSTVVGVFNPRFERS